MESIKLWGSIVNAAAILLGCGVGMLLQKLLFRKEAAERTQQVTDAVFKGMGLCILSIGITGAIKGAVNGILLNALDGSTAGGNPLTLATEICGERSLVIVISMAIGALTGELLKLDELVNRGGKWVESKVKSRLGPVADGMVTATLLFCIGSMAIMGSLNSGLYGDHTILYTKATLDMVSAIVLTVGMGIGVGFSALPVFLLQGGITLLAVWIAPLLSTDMVTCISGVGSLLIVAIGLNILGVTKLKVMNYMPAVFLPLALIPISDWIATW